MTPEKRNPATTAVSSRAVAHTNSTAGAFRPAVPAIQKMSDDHTVEVQPEYAARGAVNPYQMKGGVVQKKALVNGVPLVGVGGGKALLGKKEVNAPGEGINWINDKFARKYHSVDEFEKHAGGQEVSFGLSKRLGLWYRIPQLNPAARKFFVLGEFHNGYGYRELIAETNQKGKVLGEGGSNGLMTGTDTSPLEKNEGAKALKDDRGESREYTMENPFSKAYYGLIALKSSEKTVAGPAPVDDKESVDGALWLQNYQGLSAGDRKTDDYSIPYYENKVNGKKVYPQYGTPAEKYTVGGTGWNVLETLFALVDAKNPRDTFYADSWGGLNYFINTYKNKKNRKWTPDVNIEYNKLLAAIEKGAQAEAALLAGSTGNRDRDMPSFIDKVKERKGTSGKAITESDKAFAHRDFVMYKSVLKAKDEGFVMAGMGDNHAAGLKTRLATDGIDVINYADFLTGPISEDAIKPMTEQDPGFALKENAQEQAKKDYLDALEALRKDAEEKEQRRLQTEEQMKTVTVVVDEKTSKSLMEAYGVYIKAGTVVLLSILVGYAYKYGIPGMS